jgi:hypothetical protein
VLRKTLDGYTSVDSYTGVAAEKYERRIYEVKQRRYATSGSVTQYLHWAAEEEMFKFQVLKDDRHGKVVWGVYEEPINFHLCRKELTEITYAEKSEKTRVGNQHISKIKYRGDILLYFKRNRPKRRFLAFARDLGVRLVETTP